MHRASVLSNQIASTWEMEEDEEEIDGDRPPPMGITAPCYYFENDQNEFKPVSNFEAEMIHKAKKRDKVSCGTSGNSGSKYKKRANKKRQGLLPSLWMPTCSRENKQRHSLLPRLWMLTAS